MRIGLDCRKILHPEKGEAAGVGHYIHHLLQRLLETGKDDTFVLFFDDREAAEARREFLSGHPNATVRMLPFHAFRRHLPFIYSHMVVSEVFRRERLDVLHCPANVTPLFYRGRTVVTVHDLAIYDHPEWFPGVLPGAQSFSTRVIVPRSLKAAKRVIAVSESTKRDIIRNFFLEEGKIKVVHEGVEIKAPTPGESSAVLSRHGLRAGKYVLTLSTVEPRKNIDGLIRAFVRSVRDARVPEDVSLIIAGAKGWKSEAAFRARDEANRALGGTRVRWIGYLPHAEKAAVIAGAAVFAYPSFYEGFGLPVLEAMALGVPVIASSTSSLPEVCGDAALLVDPHDADSLASALADLFSDPVMAAGLVEKGRKQAEKFSWQAAAVETLQCYREAAAA